MVIFVLVSYPVVSNYLREVKAVKGAFDLEKLLEDQILKT